MGLNLQGAPGDGTTRSGVVSIDNMTWWFWVKAGIGFSVGVFCVYLAITAVWIFLLTQAPSLIFTRMLRPF